ncbi:hypothetical protein AVEN_172844-1 [Araneus ventricosus]|uniref:Uncharacterized protein n=1 Tax=Araneus ventricosus TaxID=182803 RepID=A0A4Y2PFV7_ARAVE|nr:hypothetical protein AVEN_172844-1 [Araneus ventricosus]
MIKEQKTPTCRAGQDRLLRQEHGSWNQLPMTMYHGPHVPKPPLGSASQRRNSGQHNKTFAVSSWDVNYSATTQPKFEVPHEIHTKNLSKSY